jgi:hypothetical protein
VDQLGLMMAGTPLADLAEPHAEHAEETA